jgi:enoyl-CoA hydratase
VAATSRYAAAYSYLRVECEEGLAVVTLNRPERQNTFFEPDHGELSRIIGDLAADADVRAILVQAAGPVFSAGGAPEYIESLIDDQAKRARAHDEIRHEIHSLVSLDKPLVAAVTGSANGAALAIAMLADVVVAERHVRFREPHVLLGLAAGDHAVLAWPVAMGLVKAKRYLLTGDSLSAEEAETLGLVSEVVAEGDGIRRARVYAERFAAAPVEPVRATKRALQDVLRRRLAAFDLSLGVEILSLTSGTTREALRRLAAGEPGLMTRDGAR